MSKSQAALEFLTTYGWAFLVILIMIAALSYFGILSPSKLLPDRCTFGAQFACLDFVIDYSATDNPLGTDGTFKLRLRNNLGEPIDVSAMTLGSEGTTQYLCGTTAPTNPQGWKPGEITELIWRDCGSKAAGFALDDRAKILITIKYNSVASGNTYTKEAKGDIYGTVT